MSTLRQLNVFFSFPSDMERYAGMGEQVISENNSRWERDHAITLRALTFKQIPSTYNPKGNQATIIDEFFGKFQVYCGFMGPRFGSPTPTYGSGTEEEYNLAVQMHGSKETPKYILFGFCEKPVNPFGLDPDQLKAAITFRKTISAKQLYYTWQNDNEFKKEFLAQIDGIVHRFVSDARNAVPGGARYS
jgi:hypothetical protein